MIGRSERREKKIETLTSRLDDLRESRRKNAGWDAAYMEILEQLNREGFISQICPTGAVFPDFVLPSAEGRLVAFSEQLARGPVVVSFFRGAWCPFCKLMLDALTEALPRIEAAGARLLALTPETGGLALGMKRRHGAGFDVLADVDFGVGLAAGVVFKIPKLYLERLVASGVDLPLRHGNAAWCLPVPATFVIAPDGVVAWRFVHVDFSRRAEPDEIIAALRGI
ncbi:MAG TPA: peroxiredoxin-like family protein [Acidocella sp.]|nr:peroxiredoxin-like family protein [Acidocella sp.]